MQSFKRSPINAACSSAQNKHVRVNCSNNIYSRYFLLPNSFTFLKPSGSLGLDTYVSVSLLVLLDENIILLVGNLVLSYGLEPCHWKPWAHGTLNCWFSPCPTPRLQWKGVQKGSRSKVLRKYLLKECLKKERFQLIKVFLSRNKT